MTQVVKFPIQTLVALAIGLLAVTGPVSQSFAQDGTATAVQSPKQKYTTAQLNKLQTLQLVASSNNARTERLYWNFRPFLTREQQRQSRQVVATYSEEFDRLRDERNLIMANASDKNGTPEKLLDWRSRTFDLANEIRRDIKANVFTDQQRKDFQRESKRQNELKAAKIKAVAAKNANLESGKVADAPTEKKVEQP